jgi:hypothetical protein
MDPLLRQIHPLDAFETEQELDLVRRTGSADTCCRIVPRAFCTFWLNETPRVTRPDRSTVTRCFS